MSANEPEATLSSKYKLVRSLGAGGMGSVYLARDLTLNRDVAIKFVALSGVGDATATRRLVREAQAAAALDHPFICSVHEVATGSDGRPYIVMQFVEGETLADQLRRGPLDPRAALTLAADIADALRAAHGQGVIHRDLKPQNIIMTPSGRPKLVDFGIAHILQKTTPAIGENEETHTNLTGPDQVVGTPGYMSPEQLQHRPVDGRSDLFSLGAVLFQCLTGRPAFAGRSSIEIGGQVLLSEPQRVSSLRPELTARHDDIVSRLLAKDPSNRFQSAEEVLGALRAFAPSGTHDVAVSARPSRRRWAIAATVAALAVLGTAVGVWLWQRREAVPEPTVEARQWYQRGTDSIRNGAYYSGRLALEEAVRLFPAYPQAYARLAEAHSELDEERDAQNALLRVTQLLPDRSRLDADDRLTIDAITAIVLRDVERGVSAYRQLAERRPREAGVWLDLGRAQEAAAIRADARRSYERAIEIDSQYAAAHLRLGSLDAQEGRRAQAEVALENAERLYRIASNPEGETESLLRRGSFLNDLGEVAAARGALERARSLASSMGSRYHEIRAQLQLTAVTASQGRLQDAELLATQAVDAARDAGLDTVAAEGLVELGTTLQLRRNLDAAQTQLDRAISLAEERNARRLTTRAKLQAASLLLSRGKPEDAVRLAGNELAFVRAQRYPRFELTALGIISRAHEDLGRFEEARTTAQQALEIAERIQDDTQIALALENLAGQSSTLGLLPDALRNRERAEDIHRRQGNAYTLPFDLTNRAELLIRLGHGEKAEALLREVDAGIDRGIDAYIGRTRRVKLLRTLRATVDGRWADTVTAGLSVGPGTGKTPDGTALLASALVDHARARLSLGGTRVEPDLPTFLPLPTSREIRYWRIATRLVSGESAQALAGASELLDELSHAPSHELEWRLAATGAAAARQQPGLEGRARDLADRARQAWQRLETTWLTDLSIYTARPDIVDLRRRAGLESLTLQKGAR
jgi:tetratricopeptide (TPR) repeat protein